MIDKTSTFQNSLKRVVLSCENKGTQQRKQTVSQILEKLVQESKSLRPAKRADSAKNLNQQIQNMQTQLQEKDRQILGLQQYEYFAKKAIEQKNLQQQALEAESQQVKTLEKDRELLRSALNESRQHSQQLERAIEFTQKRIEELQVEKKQLLDENLELKENELTVSKALEASQRQLEEIKESCHQEKAQSDELNEELKALYEQFDKLKRQILQQKQSIDQHQKELVTQKESLLASDRDKEQLLKSLNDYKVEIAQIKQSMIRVHQGAKELETRYCEEASAKLEALRALKQYQREQERVYAEYALLKGKYKDLSDNFNKERTEFSQHHLLLNQQITLLHEQIEEYCKEQERLNQKTIEQAAVNDHLINECDHLKQVRNQLEEESSGAMNLHKKMQEELTQILHRNSELEAEKEKGQQELEWYRIAMEEQQLQFDEAQKHLAKKMREVALSQQKIEELTQQLEKNQQTHREAHEINEQLQKALSANDEEKRSLTEKMQIMEKECKSLEERLALADRRWKESNSKIAQLEGIEKRHQQLQSLLSGLEPTVKSFGIVSAIAETPSPPKPERPRLQFGDEIAESQEESNSEENQPEVPAKAYPNLFDLPSSPGWVKQDLFDE